MSASLAAFSAIFSHSRVIRFARFSAAFHAFSSYSSSSSSSSSSSRIAETRVVRSGWIRKVSSLVSSLRIWVGVSRAPTALMMPSSWVTSPPTARTAAATVVTSEPCTSTAVIASLAEGLAAVVSIGLSAVAVGSMAGWPVVAPCMQPTTANVATVNVISFIAVVIRRAFISSDLSPKGARETVSACSNVNRADIHEHDLQQSKKPARTQHTLK